MNDKLNTYDPSTGWTLWCFKHNLDNENYDTLKCDWTICIEYSGSDIYPELPYRSLCLYGGRLVDLEVYTKLLPLEDQCYIPYMDIVEEILQLRESYDTKDFRDPVEDVRAIINAATSPDPDYFGNEAIREEMQAEAKSMLDGRGGDGQMTKSG